MLAESEKLKVIDRLERYCAYQERCHQEVRSKLLKIKVFGDDLEEIMSHLVQNNFLNEERFARAFARGKFRIKQWGRQRIKMELKRRDISEYCIRKGLEEIADEEYGATARELSEKLLRQYPVPISFADLQKAKQRMVRRGFEYDLVNELMSQTDH